VQELTRSAASDTALDDPDDVAVVAVAVGVAVAVAVAVGTGVAVAQGVAVGGAGGFGGGGGGFGTLTGLPETFLPPPDGVFVGCAVAVGASVGVSVDAKSVGDDDRAAFPEASGSLCAAKRSAVPASASRQTAESAAMVICRERPSRPVIAETKRLRRALPASHPPALLPYAYQRASGGEITRATIWRRRMADTRSQALFSAARLVLRLAGPCDSLAMDSG
jgi:hypothetical protein